MAGFKNILTKHASCLRAFNVQKEFRVVKMISISKVADSVAFLSLLSYEERAEFGR